MAFSQVLAWRYAPVEAVMGLSQKILYCHVPLAWWSLASFLLTAVAGGLYLRTRRGFWDNLAVAATESGVLFAGLTLVTGMIWARQAWGVWWTGDPRLTTFLVLWLMYAGCLLLRGAGNAAGPERGRRAALPAAPPRPGVFEPEVRPAAFLRKYETGGCFISKVKERS